MRTARPLGRFALYASAVVVALFCIRVLGEPWSTHFPPTFPDALNPGRSDTYYAVSKLTPFRPSFYFSPRPIVYPAFLWFLGRSSQAIVLAQTLIYSAAVGALCVTAWQALKTRAVASVTVVLLVLIAIEARFALWTTQILSESLGISLGLLAVAAWWRVSSAPTKRRVTWAWVWTIAWLLERDAQTLPVALVIVPIAAACWYWGRSLTQEVRHQLIAGALIALVACGYVYVAQTHSGRNRYSVEDNIGLRVLPTPSLRRWFVQGGMPMNAAVEGRRGKSAFDDNRAFDTDPDLASMHNWVEGPGSRRMLESFLLRSPDYYRMLSKQWNSILSDNLTAYDGYGVHHRVPSRYPLQVGGPGTSQGLRVWLFLAVATLGFAAALSRRRRGPLIFAAGGLVAVLVDLYLSFAGDALEVTRHLVGPLDRLSVMLMLSIAISVDLMWQARRPTTEAAAPAPSAGDQLTLGIPQGG
jgi:hypothetical protein